MRLLRCRRFIPHWEVDLRNNEVTAVEGAISCWKYEFEVMMSRRLGAEAWRHYLLHTAGHPLAPNTSVLVTELRRAVRLG